MSFGRILALTDLSKASQAGLELARSLARRLHARVTLGHVHARSGCLRSAGTADVAVERLEAWAYREEEEQLRNLATSSDSSMSVDDIRTVDAPSTREGVVLLEERVDPDLICMSAHGHTGSDHSLVGSMTEHTVRNARVPVIVARGGSLPGPGVPLRVLVDAARVRLAHVRLARDAPHLSIKVRRGPPGGVLCAVAREWGAHLIVARTHGRRVYDTMTLGSVSEFLLRKCRSPILIYAATY